jgi:hypothetical protein
MRNFAKKPCGTCRGDLSRFAVHPDKLNRWRHRQGSIQATFFFTKPSVPGSLIKKNNTPCSIKKDP